MRYAKYNFYVNEQTGEKTLPLEVDGVCFTDTDELQLVGYLDENADIDLLAQWSVIELDESEFLDLILTRNEHAVIVEGKAVFPSRSILGS
jgi:hypothetical protein